MSSQVESYRVTVKETVTSIVIAFVMAFVARGFVVEAFLIPTGSMAPTLMGAHIRVTSPATGYTWPVGPWYYQGPGMEIPLPIQGTRERPVVVRERFPLQAIHNGHTTPKTWTGSATPPARHERRPLNSGPGRSPPGGRPGRTQKQAPRPVAAHNRRGNPLHPKGSIPWPPRKAILSAMLAPN